MSTVRRSIALLASTALAVAAFGFTLGPWTHLPCPTGSGMCAPRV